MLEEDWTAVVIDQTGMGSMHYLEKIVMV